MNIQERIEALETEFNERLKALKAEAQQEDEFPQEGYEFWFITSSGDVARMFWHADLGQEQSLSIGNVFKTSEEAEFAVEKLKVEAELRNFSTKYQPYAELYTISFFHNNSQKVITITANQAFQDVTFYFESEEKAKQAIESVGEERIKKYIFGVEG